MIFTVISHLRKSMVVVNNVKSNVYVQSHWVIKIMYWIVIIKYSLKILIKQIRIILLKTEIKKIS